MERPRAEKLTLRMIVEGVVRPGKRLQSLLDDPLMEMPLEEVMLDKDRIMKRIRLLPHIGDKTTHAIDEALKRHASVPVDASGSDNQTDNASSSFRRRIFRHLPDT